MYSQSVNKWMNQLSQIVFWPFLTDLNPWQFPICNYTCFHYYCLYSSIFELIFSPSKKNSTLLLTCRSFENNWNTYKLLAHINPPDVKVKTIIFIKCIHCVYILCFFFYKAKKLHKFPLWPPEQHQCSYRECWRSLCWYECCRSIRCEDGTHPGSQYVGSPWRLWWAGTRTGGLNILSY